MKSITVSLRGKGDYTDVQSAIDNADGDGAVIYIKEGVYRQRLLVNRPGIRLVGQGRVVIVYGIGAVHKDPYGKPYGTFKSETVRITSRDFTAENIIFVNDAGPGDFAGQAVAVYISADRARFRKCSFLGNQDTIYTGNPDEAGFPCRGGLEHRQYFEDCYIEGDVDFIFGNGTVVFDRCEISSIDRHEPSGGCNGYITAASTRPETRYGYVFLKCRLVSSGEENTVYLGRPWRDYANVVFADCEMGSHIKKEGWHNWGNPEREKTSRYSEWGSTGAGGAMEGRVSWRKEIPEEERAAYTPENILRGEDGWRFEFMENGEAE
ncbi:MAG: pectinesterase family protein [Roseburia sp.]|nr:pectinesterase family protein [Roseburia sp.]MCM1097502.1 pectinesterase family protein [Ruminococcus flavefaciens]